LDETVKVVTQNCIKIEWQRERCYGDNLRGSEFVPEAFGNINDTDI